MWPDYIRRAHLSFAERERGLARRSSKVGRIASALIYE
jgi:hypothetical protein